MAYDNVSGGDKKNYWPALTDPYASEMEENLNSKLDPQQIRLVQTTVGFSELDIHSSQGHLMQVVTDRALQSIAGGDLVDAMFTFGESARRDFGSLNAPWPPGGDPITNGGRENGFIHTIDFGAVVPPIDDFLEVGLGGGGPFPPEGWMEFAIWEQDSQGNWFKICSWPIYTKVQGIT
jgi:hypothetical protein